MTRVILEELEQTIKGANESPIQKMCCQNCYYGHTETKHQNKFWCTKHGYYIKGGLASADKNLCFGYQPSEE